MAKKVAKKAVAPAGRRAAPKKAAAKKTVKKAAKKKPVDEKTRGRKAAPKTSPAAKKVTAMPAPQRKQATKSGSVNKKKARPEKVTAPQKKIAGSASARGRRHAGVKPASSPGKENQAAASELSEEMHEQVVHEEKQSQSKMRSAEGAKKLERKEDPIMAFDMHMAQKATSKGDRNNKMRISSTGQRPLRPSGKKPLW